MSTTPKHIDRKRLLEAVKALGIDPQSHRITLHSDKVEVVGFQRDETGARFLADPADFERGYAKTFVEIPVVDLED